MISNTKKTVLNNKDKAILICQYLLKDYILSTKLAKACARTIGHIDVEKIKNNIYNDCHKTILAYKTIYLSKIMTALLTTHCKEKYYYNLNDWYFFLKYMLDINLSYIITVLDFFINIKNICISIYDNRFKILNNLLKLESYYSILRVGIDTDKWELYYAIRQVIEKLIYWGHIAYSYRPVELAVDIARLIYGFFVKKEENTLTLSKMIGYIDLLLYVVVLLNMKTWVI